MSDLALKKCPVCLEKASLDKVVFFQCGHKSCLQCYERLPLKTDGKSKARFCAECRAKIQEPPLRIYLSSDDIAITKPEPQNKIVDGLNKISEDTPAVSVMRASGKIQRMQESNGHDPATAKALVRAIEDLDKRIAPLFGRLEEIKAENDGLCGRLQELELSNQTYREKAKKAKLSLRDEKGETERQRQRAESYLSIIKLKEAEIASLQGEIEERDKQNVLMKKKLKVLSKTQKHQSRISHDVDASLQIEDNPHESLHQHNRARPTRSLLHNPNRERRVHSVKRKKEMFSEDELMIL
ncbi:hypothetical protein GALMADRAFT_240408 [Galerina marginata CBS 339.88]|uniref:RING-type domain-containing protein n=1 Tax=Galerina marginata (strain CBS 339.88) TaxID=685588 RepID=A0A067TQ36_GALM3|nr:hypothetical protein GALMADRAFT_240408 [Galerina marginata CBS 339.88]